jgi:hypothetical protein
MIVEIIVNYYTPQGRVWVYHRDIQLTVEVEDKQAMRQLESDITKAISKRGKPREESKS